MQWPVITRAWLLNLSLPCTNSLLQDSKRISLEHISHGFLVGRCSPLGGSCSFHFGRVRNSDFVSGFKFLRNGHCAIWVQSHLKALPIVYLMFSCCHLSRGRRKMVKWWLSSQNLQGRSDSTCCLHVEDGEQRTDAGKAVCHWCIPWMVLTAVHPILLLPRCDADNTGNVTRIR